MATRLRESSFRGFLLTDLGVVSTLGVFAIAVGTGLMIDFPGRGVIGLLAVIFAPGYAVVAALFPADDTDSNGFEQIHPVVPDRSVTTIERLLLGVGLSICLVPLIGVLLNYTPAGISATALLAITGLVTVIAAGLAAIRRGQVSASNRFDPDIVTLPRTAATRLRAVGSGSKLSFLLILGFVVVGAGIGVAVIDADRGEEFSSVYLLSEDPDTDEYVAGEYPNVIQQGDSEELRVGVDNYEGEETEYTVIAQLHAVDENGEIEEAQTIDEFEFELESGGSWEDTHSVSPEISGEPLRLTYMLYTEQPPDEDVHHPEDAYRHTHIWIEVS